MGQSGAHQLCREAIWVGGEGWDERKDNAVSTERLLILSCSRRKRSEPGLLPAAERYDGPAFRMLRKYARAAPAPPTWILSAEYGLISADQPLPVYDRQMTAARAQELRPQVWATLARLDSRGYAEALVCAGRAYAAALAGLGERLGCPVTFNSGPMGRQLSVLRDWLYGAPPETPTAPKGKPVIFRGQSVDFSIDEVLRLAHQRAAKDPAGATRYAGWYVSAGELRVAPKWLVSQLTGIPVSGFRTGDARRLLAALGVEVVRA